MPGNPSCTHSGFLFYKCLDGVPRRDGSDVSVFLSPDPIQVEDFRQQDAKEGLRVAQVLEGFISRKVVKQTVMTVVYGVTRYGGRLQIEKRLRELSDFPQVCSLLGPYLNVAPFSTGTLNLVLLNSSSPLKPGFWLWARRGATFWPRPPIVHIYGCPHRSLSGKPHTTSCARSSKVYRRCSPAPGPFRCVPASPLPSRGTPPPHGSLTQPGVLSRLQHWLTESANLISHAGWPVEWVTPLGIPVIQPYHRESKVQVLGKCPSPLPSSPVLPAQGWTHLSPALQVKGGIQSITFTSSVDDNQ